MTVVTSANRLLPAGLLALACAACSPTLDWREVRCGSPAVVALFPCKPVAQERALSLAGQSWQATLRACDAQGMTFAVLSLAQPQPTDPKQPDTPPGPVQVQALQESAAQRWGPVVEAVGAAGEVKLPAFTSSRWSLHRRQLEDGRTIESQALFVAHGPQLLQISVSGPRLEATALESFFGGLRW